jgi:biotin carboxyl carrier protein
MKLRAELAGQRHEVSLQLQGQSVSAEIDGRRYEFQVRDLEAGAYLLLEGTRVHNCRIEAQNAQSESYFVHVCSNSYEVLLADPRRLSTAPGSVAHQHGAAEIVASMPGKVVRVLVEVGAKVAAGQGIVVVEAMKMQNEMKVPRAGTVISLKAEPGATVNAGDVLAVIE